MKVVNQSANSTVKVGLVIDGRNVNLEHKDKFILNCICLSCTISLGFLSQA